MTSQTPVSRSPGGDRPAACSPDQAAEPASEAAPVASLAGQTSPAPGAEGAPGAAGDIPGGWPGGNPGCSPGTSAAGKGPGQPGKSAGERDGLTGPGSFRLASDAPAVPRSWTLEMPAGIRLLSLNDRRHWAEKGRITRDLRHAAWALARQAQIPPLGKAKITVEYQPPLVTRRRDLDNVGPASGKPCIDGICTDGRVLAGDDKRYLTEVTYLIGEPYPRGRLVLTVTEVLPDGAL